MYWGNRETSKINGYFSPTARANSMRSRTDATFLADRPEAANQLVKFMRQVLAFAVENDLIKHNVAKDVPYIFLFNNKYEFYLASNNMQKQGDTFRYDLGYTTWWMAGK